MNANPGPAGTVSAATLARLLMIGTERIRQLSTLGYISRPSHGRYDLVGGVQGYLRFRQESRDRAAPSAAATHLADAKAEEIQRRIDREDRDIILTSEALQSFDRACSLLIGSLRSLPSQINNRPAERHRVAAIIAEDIERLERAFARGRHRLVTGHDDEPEDEE